MDDLTGLNVDSFVYLGRKFTGNQFTIRLTAISVENGLGYAGGEVGNQTPAWVTNPPKALVDYVSRDGVIAIRADIAGQPLVISLGDLLTGVAPTAVVENLRTGETENVTMLQDADNDPILPVYSVKLPTAANGNVGGSNDGTLNVWPLDIIRVSYVDEDNSYVDDLGAPVGPVTIFAEAEIPLETLEPVPPASDDSSGCSCSTSPDGRIDPILPAAVLFALGFLGLRRWEAKRKQER
jgi:MYXO-CTERM domain-containing protein